MASSRASTAGCATSASTSTCSPTSTRRVTSSKHGGSTTTSTDRTRASTGSPQLSSQHAPSRGKTGTDSPYERGQVGEQVRPSAQNAAPFPDYSGSQDQLSSLPLTALDWSLSQIRL